MPRSTVTAGPMRHAMPLVALLGFTAGLIPMPVHAQGSPEQQVVWAAAEALGGRDRLLAVKSLTIEGYASNPNIGQAMTPESDPLLWMIPDYKRSIDLENGRMALEFTRRPAFPAVFDNFRQNQRLDGDVAFNVGGGFGPLPANPPAFPSRLSAATARERRLDSLMHPLTALRAALDPRAGLKKLKTTGVGRSVEVTTAIGDVFTLGLDTQNRPVSVSMAIAHPNLGDTTRVTTFGAYEDLDGLRLPKRLVTTLDRWVEYDVGVMKNSLDADVSALAAPEGTRSAAAAPDSPPQNLVVTVAAQGIWFVTGAGVPSLIIEFADHVAIVEAPSEARFLAVLAKARELVPGKPVTQLILTHHHFDHTGGLRAAVAQGLTVIAHKINAPWFREAVARKHSIGPDALSRARKPLMLVAVDDARVLKDQDMEVVLYHLAQSTHGDGLLALYFPRERLLAEADVWNPGAQLQPHLRSLDAEIKRRNLAIDRVIPLHGQQIQPYTQLEAVIREWAGRRATTTTYIEPGSR
jgi:glyoxylase-like metal-dependent hydrolase (beta-lactamase superfamily II)